MNEPPLDRTENVVDIFVLSISESIGPQLTEQLEDKGYQVTLFSDSRSLLETLAKGKPNLLICDTTTIEDGFEVCRRIKADSDLWVIPVLIFTGGSLLADFLNVLDCNADNFLAYPSDLPYRLSLIDSMLTTPVERQTPDLIKTQFKINHEDRIYVVAASRRKILELLLSSFEIAVNKSSELSDLKREVRRLTELSETLEESVTEHTCVIDLLNASVKQKEQKISALTAEGADKARAISQKTEEIRQLSQELDTEKARAAAGDEKIRSMIREKEEIESFHCSEIDALRQQVAGLLTQVENAQMRITSVQREYEEEKTHGLSLEGTLREVTAHKEEAERSLGTLEPEHERLKSWYEEEKARLLSLEATLSEVTAQKEKAERSLGTLEPEHERLKSGYEGEKARLLSLEATLREVTAQKEEAEKSLGSLVPEHEHLKSAFEEEKARLLSLESTLRDTGARKERAESTLNSLVPEHEHLKSVLDAETNRADSAERKIQVITQDKAQSEQDLGQRIADLEQSLLQREADLGQLRDNLEDEKKQRISEAGLARSLAQDKEQSELSLQLAISELRERLNALQEEFASATASLEDRDSAIRSLENSLAESAAEQEKTKGDISANQILFDTTIAQLNQALTEASGTRSALEENLAAFHHKNLEYEEQLAQAHRDNEQSSQQVRSLSGELDQAKEALGRNEVVIVSLRENLANAIREKEDTEARVKTDLDSYKTTFIRLKRDLDETLASRRTLEKDLAALKMQNSAYTEDLAQANRTKDQSVQKIRVLADELERLKEDLDAERKAHQTTDQNRAAIEMNRRRFEEDLRIASEEQKSLAAHLENEQKLRQAAEEKIHAATLEEERLREELRAVTEEHGHQEQDRAQKIQTLKKDLETVCELQKSLEEEVSILSQEKLKAEQRVQALTAELDQARAALADEWEHHMTSDERLAAAVLERQKLQESLSRPDLRAGGEEGVLEIVTQKPDLPVTVDKASHSMELAESEPTLIVEEPQSPGGEPSSGPDTVTSETALRNMNFSEIEDLFEDDESPGQPGGDAGSYEKGSEMEIPVAAPAPDIVEEGAGDVDLEYDEIGAGEPVQDTGSYEKGTETEVPLAPSAPDIIEEETGDVEIGAEEPVQDTAVPDDIHTPIPQPLFSFNRRQWLNLIKWAHHSETLSREQKAQILRMGRLIQKNRRLTREQEDQVNEMIALVQALGYQPV